MKVLIIEDESLAAERLKRLLSEIDPTIEVIGTLKSIQSSIRFLQEEPLPDLIFSDIELSDGLCFEIFKNVKVTSAVIFTTSYNEYALDAFQAYSIDYLLKPIRQRDLLNSINKYKTMKQQFVASFLADTKHTLEDKIQEHLRSAHYSKTFLIKQGQRYVPVELSEIACFFADGRLTYIITWNNVKLVIDSSLEEIEKVIDPLLFYRANRAFIIHRKSVKKFTQLANRQLLVDLSPKPTKEVIVSKERSTDFKNWMKTP